MKFVLVTPNPAICRVWYKDSMMAQHWKRDSNPSTGQLLELSIELDFKIEEFERRKSLLTSLKRPLQALKTWRQISSDRKQLTARRADESKARWKRRRDFIFLQGDITQEPPLTSDSHEAQCNVCSSIHSGSLSPSNFDRVGTTVDTLEELACEHQTSLKNVWLALEKVLETRQKAPRIRKSLVAFWAVFSIFLLTFVFLYTRFLLNVGEVHTRSADEQFLANTLIIGVFVVLSVLIVLTWTFLSLPFFFNRPRQHQKIIALLCQAAMWAAPVILTIALSTFADQNLVAWISWAEGILLLLLLCVAAIFISSILQFLVFLPHFNKSERYANRLHILRETLSLSEIQSGLVQQKKVLHRQNWPKI